MPSYRGRSCRNWEHQGWSSFQRPICGVHVVWGLNLGSHACRNTGSLALLKFLPDSG